MMPDLSSPYSSFELKQAIERLREGLFDPVAVRLLTAHEPQLKQVFEQLIDEKAASEKTHLMICGDYGQGKSHSLSYIHEHALQQGFVVSRVNLDIRELPMHNFRQVYRALVSDIFFPDQASSVSKGASTVKGSLIDKGNAAKSLSAHWREWSRQQSWTQAQDILDFLPESMPHFFRCVLSAITQKNMPLSQRQKTLKKHAQYRPKEYSYQLNLALSGEVVSLPRLRSALKYRQVPGYTKRSLSCRGNQPYLEMIKSLAWLFQKMAFKGWILLFDEAESIAQLRIMARSQSYRLMQQLIYPEKSASRINALVPVFAITDDFFTQLRSEDYDRVRTRNGLEAPCFLENYEECFHSLNIFSLNDLSTKEWKVFIEKLIHLYCQAYQWDTEKSSLKLSLVNYLQAIQNKETRLKIKALINELDISSQETLLLNTAEND